MKKLPRSFFKHDFDDDSNIDASFVAEDFGELVLVRQEFNGAWVPESAWYEHGGCLSPEELESTLAALPQLKSSVPPARGATILSFAAGRERLRRKRQA